MWKAIILYAKIAGAPKLEIYEQEDKTMLKCSASANEHPPVLSWVMDNGLEIAGKYAIMHSEMFELNKITDELITACHKPACLLVDLWH